MNVNFTCRLASRSLLRVRGVDTHAFLQGLYTNDVGQLTPGGSQWGCFLFFTGKVICEAHLYQCRQEHDGQIAVLVDVHNDAREPLFEHLTEMKMRKKVSIEDVSQHLTVVASVHNTTADILHNERVRDIRMAEHFQDSRSFALLKGANGLPTPADTPGPRHCQLFKTVVPVEWCPSSYQLDHGEGYDRLLYTNGIGEGPQVFKYNKTLPFEGNIDLLKGVSFHKGCYVGQELTHRTHVMLVTRKRTVPLTFGGSTPPEVGDSVVIDGKDKVGEVTAVSGDVGLGVLRLRYVDKTTRTIPNLSVKSKAEVDIPARMEIPEWWPKSTVKKLLKNNE
ncbi:Aminomethyltransferase folate-binding domain containing protein, putative [Angomonas deanei]|uniref:Aminomethyltransferase folate-binding domain containing protein, putative n=1 Tax=Angomonas deanei TaxID=59799 RepID=A0A7G2CNH1_9TRYP|nr:Aminomethyltransferase folate-binding domain containing protein, putative [Angomonas deanei]